MLERRLMYILCDILYEYICMWLFFICIIESILVCIFFLEVNCVKN